MKKIITLFLSFTVTFLSLLIPAASHCMLEREEALKEAVLRDLCNTRFVNAAQEGDLDLVKILAPVAYVNARTGKNKLTALRQACQEGHDDIVKFLLVERHARPDILDVNEVSPLSIASEQGHLAIVNLLLENGALATLNTKSSQGAVPLRQACQARHHPIVECLCQAKANPNIQDIHDNAPLHIAARYGQADIARTLLSAKADTRLLDGANNSALLYASQDGFGEIVQLILAAGHEAEIDVAALVNTKGWKGITPLRQASQNGHYDIVSTLIQKKADIDVLDEGIVSPLHMASKNGHVAVVRLLLHHKADASFKNKGGKPAIDFTKNQEIKEMLARAMEEEKEAIERATHMQATKTNKRKRERWEGENPAGPEMEDIGPEERTGEAAQGDDHEAAEEERKE